MKIGYIALASMIAAPTMAYAQNYNNSIGVDVTPKAQVEANTENAKREAEERRRAEARAEQDRLREVELQRARIQARSAEEVARLKAQGEIEAAKKRKPDACYNCNFWR